jgi:hypothetical protein
VARHWLPALSRYDGLRAVRLTPLGAYAAGLAPSYEPSAPATPERGLQVLPNLDVVALADLPPAERMLLDAFATRAGDQVWRLSRDGLHAALDGGRTPAEPVDFLADRAAHGLPPAVRTLVDDVQHRCGQIRDLGLRRVVERADAQVATLLASDRALRGLCTRVGERHLLLDPDGEAKARPRSSGWAIP